jgi:hypothetical protein
LGIGALGALGPTRSTNRRSQRALFLFLPLLAAAAVHPSPLAALLLLLSLLLDALVVGRHLRF